MAVFFNHKIQWIWKKAKPIRLTFLSGLLFGLFLPAVVCAGELNIDVLDVGQGLSVLFESDGHYMIYDGGGRDHSSYVVSYLKQKGIGELDYVVASHYDEDHISGLVGVLNVFACDQVLSPDYEADTSIYESFVNAERSSGAELVHPEQGQTYLLGGAEFTVVGPAAYKEETDNDNSIAIRVTDQEVSCLVCGDAESTEEGEILSSGLDLTSDIYIASHHGSGTSNSQEFLNAVNPTVAVISCGAGNAYGHPDQDVMELLQERGCYLFRTDLQSEIILSTDGEQVYFGQDICTDWSPGTVPETADTSAEISAEAGGENVETTGEYKYICNENSKKFHYPSCDSVKKMSEKNKRYTDQSREELISQGYDPCKNCNP